MNKEGSNKTPIQGISCDATECIHNNHKSGCTATNVKVGSPTAKSCKETCCDSFKPGCSC